MLRDVSELAGIAGPIYLAIGVFDGVHLGHRSVLNRALADARAGGGSAVAVTFDPHPAKILRPADAPRLLTATGHKLELFRELGIAAVLVIPFTRGICGDGAGGFCQSITRRLPSAEGNLRRPRVEFRPRPRR